MARIGILGFGTVGQQVYRILQEERESIRAKTGHALTVDAVLVRDLSKVRATTCDCLTMDPDAILKNKDITVVVEVMGGVETARDHVLAALRAGKHVVTANKALLSAHLPALLTAAQESKVGLAFEASVAGCVPVIRTLQEAMVSERLRKIYGIVNGTTNYILTRMEEGSNYKGALFEAQEKGYAEAEPSFDVDGHDAAQKLSVLIAVGYGLFVPGKAIFTEGITRVAREDMMYAKKLGRVIKLLAIATHEQGVLQARVHPVMLPESHFLASVRHENNALFLEASNVGEMTLIGKGAGGAPTASAVVSNILDVLSGHCNVSLTTQVPVMPMQEAAFEYYLRHTVLDTPGVLHKISGILAEHNISIADVVQVGRNEDEPIPLIIRTHLSKEKAMMDALHKIDALDVVKDATVLIRNEG